MPQARKAFYNFYSCLTGCIPLCLVVASVAGPAMAQSDEGSTDASLVLGYAALQELSVQETTGADQPLAMIVQWEATPPLVLRPDPIPTTAALPQDIPAAPLALPEVQSNQPPAAIAVDGVSLAQAVVAVPWDAAQMPGGVPAGGGMVPGMVPGTVPGMVPGMMPGMVPGYPMMAPVGGMWMTVWVPYGAPMMPGMPGAPAGMMPGMPMSGMPAPGMMPGMPAPGMMPGMVPGAGYGVPMMAWPGMMPGMPGMAPGVAPGMMPGMAPGMMPGMTVQPYAQISPPPSPSPLAVPSVPAGGTGQGLPQPPTLSPTLPPTNFGGSAIPPTATIPAPALPNAVVPSPAPGASPWQSGLASPTLPLGVDNPTFAQPNAVPSPAPPLALDSAALDSPGQSLTEPNLTLQGLYLIQDDQSSARARLSGDAFLTPNLLVGGSLDFVTGPDLTSNDGVQLTELYLATAVPGVPGLRFRVGQLDITSYFDRNSFAKDNSRDFFNSTFNTNPALIAGANATASRPAGLVQWAITDDLNLSASVFSSASSITDFALDGFAGEVGFRTGNLIVRGTFLTGRDTQFQGTGDRLDAYGVNAEWFIPNANLGLFGRYGRLNSSSGFSGDTYSVGLNALDVFMDNDRLGLGYGRNLPNAVETGTPDVLELFYDFEALPNVRVGFTFQQRNQLRESFAGFRIRGDLNVLPPRSQP